MKSENDLVFFIGGAAGIFFGLEIFISPIQKLRSVTYDFGNHHELIGVAIITFGAVCIYSAIRKKK